MSSSSGASIPRPSCRIWRRIAATGRQFYFQYTLNAYEAEGLEPGLPSLCRRLETFKRLADTIGPQRVIWRCDPLIVGGGLSTDTLLERIDRLGRELSPYTEKLVFSFVDMYRKTAAALQRLDPAYRAPTADEMRELARGIATLNAGWPHRLELATCAEGIDLSALGIHKNKCIDDVLIRRLCPQDTLVQAELAPRRQLSLLPGMETAASASKDTGQRTACGCIPSKDIGAYDSCPHFCVYCYANRSEQAVRANLLRCRQQQPEMRECLLP